MENKRLVIRSAKDQHILIDVFKSVYPKEDTPKVRNYYEHHHSEFEISTVVSGSGCYCCGNVDYDFIAGDVFVHTGNDNHCFKRIDDSAQLSLIVVRFEPRLLWASNSGGLDTPFSLFIEGLQNHKHISADSIYASKIRELLSESFLECQSMTPECELLVKANLLKTLAFLSRAFSLKLVQATNGAKESHIKLIDQSIDYIFSHLDQPLTLEMIAKEVGLSRTYYATLFKQLNGINVWSYITSQRIDRATVLLSQTDLSITEICEKCGFGSVATFNRSFKNILGICPRDYRKQAGHQ